MDVQVPLRAVNKNIILKLSKIIKKNKKIILEFHPLINNQKQQKKERKKKEKLFF